VESGEVEGRGLGTSWNLGWVRWSEASGARVENGKVELMGLGSSWNLGQWSSRGERQSRT
jgi:hypothetical protein